MRSFAVVAGLVAAVNAYAYPAYNATEPSTAAEYPAYPVETPVEYPAASSAAGYPVSSAAEEYPAYTTSVVTGLTTVCPEATTMTVGTKTYTVTSSTTIVDEECEYTTSMPVHPSGTPAMPAHPSVTPALPSEGHPAPPANTPVVPYPSMNGTAPTHPAGTGMPSASSTKPPASEFTGAAAQSGAAFLAIVGAVAAFL